jgi:dienelactone hydrolase
MAETIKREIRGTDRRGGAVIDDISYPGPDDEPVVAYLVHPTTIDAPGAGAALLAWHWYDPKAPDGNRTQFVDEAVDLAGLGVVSLLPQGRFPWAADPSGAAADTAAIEAEVGRMRHGLDLLAGDSAVDAGRLALVGHDFGAMLAAVAAASEVRLRALVLIAATPRWADWFLPFWDIADDRIDYLRALRRLDPIGCIGEASPAAVLFQFARNDFYIAPMTTLEFRSAAPDGAEVLTYDGADHDMRLPGIRADRRAFLARHLDLAG